MTAARTGLTAALMVVLGAGTAAASGHPIVAVFEVEARNAPVSEQTLAALTDLLTAGLAATGQYRALPRSQVKERLTRLKLESYRHCYDQACQIELGRELAANKSLASRVVHLDGRCILILELLDLRTATTEFAHTAQGACTEAALFGMLTDGLKALGGWAVKRAPPPARAAAASQPRLVTVQFDSSPPSDVLLDGLRRGITPLRLDLEKGRGYQVVLRRDGYGDATRAFVAEEYLKVKLPLALSPEGRLALATTTEWVGLAFGPGFVNGSRAARLAFEMRIFTLKWRRFFWTIFDLNALLGFDDAVSAAGKASMVMNLGMRAGVPIYLGPRGQHQLLFGLGAYAAVISTEESVAASASSTSTGLDTRGYFSLSPGIEYTYNAYDGLIPLFMGVKAQLPVARSFAQDHYPCQLLFGAGVGFSLSRLGAMTPKRPASRRTPP